MDFILHIYLSLFFSLLPFYYTNNAQLDALKNNRDVKLINSPIALITVTTKQILSGFEYSILSTILTLIIIVPLNLLFYSDVLKDEAKKIEFSINKIEYKLKNTAYGITHKLKMMIIKLRVIFAFVNRINCIPLEAISLTLSHTMHSSTNEIFLKDNIKLQNIKKDTFKISDSFNIDSDKDYQKQIIIRFTLNGNKKTNLYKHNYMHTFAKRKIDFIENVECNSFQFVTKLNQVFIKKYDNIIRSFKIYSKILLITGLFIMITIYVAAFIRSIYVNFGDNFFKLCVMPIILILFVRLVITVNVLLLISTLFMYYYGPVVYAQKKSTISKIIYYTFVSPIAVSQHKLILKYRLIISNNH